MPVLTAIDVLGVQRFIFRSNRLRDVVTGSYLVHWSTSADGALHGLVAAGRVLLAGGGNALVESSSMEEAQSFAARYTRRLHNEAPGLEVAVIHKEYDEGKLALALQEIQVELARTKTERLPSASLLGLSVTAPCRETGLPATGFDAAESTVPLSREILKRREKRGEANRLWEAYLENRDGFAFPMELDHLGRTMGDTSLIGVVHIDGNSVGEKIKNWLNQKCDEGVDDQTVRQEFREWSQAIDQLGKDALEAVVDRVFRKIKKDGKEITGFPKHLGFPLKKVDNQWMLPLRPILLGGDDLTFVCDGRIALDLAATALSIFENSNIPHLQGGRISACAGIAVVRVHAPFARAYELAENLCSSAKLMLRKKNDPGCAMDWHIGTCRPGESVTSIRKRQYRANGRKLTCRPYRLGSGRNDVETWRWLSETLLDDRNSGLRVEPWAGRRNKAKIFPALVREGPDSVQEALKAWKVVDKRLALPGPIQADGFFAKSRTPLIDALELLDLHLVLNEDNQGSQEECHESA